MSERRGWVAVHRALLNSAVWRLPDGQRIVYVTLLLLVNHAATTWTWRGQKCSAQPGQLVTSSEKLAAAAGVTRQTVRTALKNLTQMGALTNESTKSGMLITLTNWGLHQSGGEKSTNESTNEQPTNTATNQQINQAPAKNQPTNQPNDQPTNKSQKPLPIGACTNWTDKNQPTNQPSDGNKSTNESTTNNNTNNDIQRKLTTDGGGFDNIIGQDAAQRWLTERGPDYCQAQLNELTRQGATVRDPRVWLLKGLEKNYARWKPPAPSLPKPDPHCPQCGGRGNVTDFTNNATRPCACVPRVAPVALPAPQQAVALVPSRNPAALAVAVAAKLQA